jgi:hypothetical protein
MKNDRAAEQWWSHYGLGVQISFAIIEVLICTRTHFQSELECKAKQQFY